MPNNKTSASEVQKLLRQLDTQDLDTLNSTVEQLTSIPEIEKYLIEAFSWDNIEIRKNIAWILGLLCKPSTIHSLLKSMTLDPDNEVKLTSSWALRQFELVDMLPIVFDSLPMPREFGHILYYLTSNSWKAKWYCTIIVAKKPNGKALPYLLDIANDKKEMLVVRCSAIQSLLYYKHFELNQTLVALIQEYDPFIKIEAANMAALKKLTDALPYLKKQCNSLNVDVKGNMLTAIGLLSEKEIPYELLHALKDDEELVRINASMAILEILERLPVEFKTKQGPTLIKYLEPALRDKSQYVMRNIARCLGILGDESVANNLIEYMKKEKNEDSLANLIYAIGLLGAQNAQAQLVKLVNHPNWQIRFHAIKALGEIKAKKAYKVIVKALQDPSMFVKEQAAHSLGLIEHKGAIKPLEKMLMKYPYEKRLKTIISNSLDHLLGLN